MRVEQYANATMISNDKKNLSFGTEMPDDQTVLSIEFAGRTIAPGLFL